MQVELEELEFKQEQAFLVKYEEKFEKKRKKLEQKHKKEMRYLKIKLEKPLNEKLRQRETELATTLRRFEKKKNDLKQKQNREISRQRVEGMKLIRKLQSHTPN